MNTFQFDFEELPLIIERGIEAGLIAGSAEISYGRQDGEWLIDSISLDGYRLATDAEREAGLSRYQHGIIELDAASPIYRAIYNRLETEWSGKVQDAVNEQIAEDRQCAADDAADHRRDLMIEAAE